MANQQLSNALPEVDGVKVYYVDYDGNANYPLATPPGPAPCMVVVHDAGYLYYTHFYIELAGQAVPLVTGFYAAGGS